MLDQSLILVNATGLMAETAPWWNGVNTDLLAEMSVPLHPGAVRYYTEVGVELPEALLP